MSYILTRVCDISFLFQIIIHSRTQSRSYARSATRGSGKIQTGYHKNITQLQIEHAQCLTGYHVFMVSGLDFARAPRLRIPQYATPKTIGVWNVHVAQCTIEVHK